MAAALTLGASAATIGTAFLRCSKRRRIRLGRRRSRTRARRDDADAGVYRQAGRTIATDYVRAAAAPDAPAPAPYPVQRGLTEPMKAAGAAAGDHHRMQVWAGQSAAMGKPIPAGDLVAQNLSDARNLL